MTIQEPAHSQSLVRRLTRLNLTVLFSSMVMSFVLIGVILWFTARERQADAAELAGLQSATNLAAMLVFQDQSEARRELDLLASRRDLAAVAIFNPEGQLFTHTNLPQPLFVAATDTVQRDYHGLTITLQVPIRERQEIVGYLVLHERMQQLMQWFLQGLLLMSGIMAVLYVLSARVLVRIQQRALQPLVELSALAERVATERNFALRGRVYYPDELGSLTKRFNELLKRAEIWQGELTSQLQHANEQSEQLSQLALHDSLTGLGNRLAFQQALSQRVAHSVQHQQLLALVFIDLDNFKYVNDTYGHDAGDALLILVSQRLSQVLRSDDFLGRLGGDEFAVLLPNQVSPQACEQVCHRLLAQIREPLVVHGQVMPVGASLGVAFCPQHTTQADTLLQYADEAMYVAKRAGKNDYYIYQTQPMAE